MWRRRRQGAKETLKKQWRRKSVGRERVRIYLRQKGQPARAKMAMAFHPSATQPTPWPAAQPLPPSCRCPHTFLFVKGNVTFVQHNYLDLTASFYNVMIVRLQLSTLWLCRSLPCTLMPFNPPQCRSTCGEDQEAVQAQKIWKKSIMLVWRAAANHRWRLYVVTWYMFFFVMNVIKKNGLILLTRDQLYWFHLCCSMIVWNDPNIVDALRIKTQLFIYRFCC